MSVKCEGCRREITDKSFLTCVQCCLKYDLICANVLEKHFYNLMTPETKKNWICPQCISKIIKKGNTSTPIRQQREQQNTFNYTVSENVTLRKKTQDNLNDDSSCSESHTILGDTMCNQTSFDKVTQLSMENMSELKTKKLEKNNKLLLCQFQNLIQIEVKKAVGELKDKIKEELKVDIDELLKLNESRKNEIHQIKNEVEKVLTEDRKLKGELKQIEHKLTTTNNNPNSVPESNSKKIVLYGFPEYYRESDFELQHRLCDMLQENLHVNLTGYIEETRRIGRFSSNKTRPLIIELISKRMTKYLLENKGYLYGSHVAISDFLDEAARTERQTLREKMLNARNQGLYAVIRDNQLIIKDKKNEDRHETSLPKHYFSYQEKKKPFRD